MSSVMDYETLDWELEAERIARAFGLQWVKGTEYHCHFMEKVKDFSPFHPDVPRPRYQQLLWENGQSSMIVPTISDRSIDLFRCEYNEKKGMTFAVHIPSYTSGKASYLTDVTIHWNGHVKSRIRIDDNARFLARGIFNLGLLSPEVEAALGICITAQDKAEWANEFIGYIACETMDWDAEAKRVALAFGLSGEVGFVTRFLGNEKVVDLFLNGERPIFQKKLSVGVVYSYRGIYLWVDPAVIDEAEKRLYHRPYRLAEIGIRWDGSLLYPTDFKGDYLGEGLFNLGLLTPEIEAALNISTPNRHKIKWARAYRKRKKR